MLKSLILLVEDEKDILRITTTTLEIRGYDVITAINGADALKLLSGLERLPDLIISDVMMPIMDGYDLFKNVSTDLRFSQIPFIFLTAYSAPKDVRFGKMLGVDDYITKPFTTEDFYAAIEGKLIRSKMIRSVRWKIDELTKIGTKPSISEELKHQVILLYVVWDDALGPDLKSYFPTLEVEPFNFLEIAAQLFQATASIYGHEKITHAEGILLNIDNIKRDGYLYFDAYTDRNYRGGEKQYMIGVIAPKINYFESLKIKEIFKEVSLNIKKNKDWNIESCWNKITEILTKSSF
jgi:CheY-like chemotaxis protein